MSTTASRAFLALALLLGPASPAPAQAQPAAKAEGGRWTAERANAWYKARPWPVGYKTLRHRARWIEAPATRIALFEAALHEWAGLLAYRAAGHWRPMAGGTRRCIP